MTVAALSFGARGVDHLALGPAFSKMAKVTILLGRNMGSWFG